MVTEIVRATGGRKSLSGEAAASLAMRILADCAIEAAGGNTQLPNERQLASELGVSRTAVRHALAVLEADGSVTRQVGRGTFLRVDGQSEATTSLDQAPVDIGPADVMDVRRLLEPAAMALVVERATPRDFEEMDRCLLGGDESETYEEFEAWDLALHRCIIAASHNRLLVRTYEVIEVARRGQMWGDLKRRNDSRGRRDSYRGHHAGLVSALRDRDTDRAIEAMRTHLQSVSNNLFGSPAG